MSDDRFLMKVDEAFFDKHSGSAYFDLILSLNGLTKNDVYVGRSGNQSEEPNTVYIAEGLHKL